MTKDTEIQELRAKLAALEPGPATTAQDAELPQITEAEAPTGEFVREQGGTTATDQTYPSIQPAPPVVETAPTTSNKAAYVDPGKSKFARALVASLVDAGLMDPE